MRALLASLILASAAPLAGQFSYPVSASTRLYIGHFIDGGPPSQKWQTTLILTNPNPGAPAPVKVSFYNDAGQAMPLDFGQGASPTLLVAVPAGGAKSLTTVGASETLLNGWAIVETPDAPATEPATPVTATVLYRGELPGNHWWDVAAVGTGSTYFFSSYGNRDLGVALANPSRADTIHLQMTARTEGGQSAGSWTINLPPLGHRSFNLSGPPASLASFSGTIQISSLDDPPSPFVALALNYRSPVLSPLPPGETAAPSPYDRRPLDVAVKARQAAMALLAETDPYGIGRSPATLAEFVSGIGLAVDAEIPVRASYDAAERKVRLSTGLVEAMGTNDAALAFLIAHLSARGVLQAYGMPPSGSYSNDAPGLADYVAAATLLKGGFDPSGAADLFGRLLYATELGLSVDGALRNEFAIPDGVQARLQKLAENLRTACGSLAGMQQVCQAARRHWHPHNPANIP
ncbi:MAG: hypothetical protein IT159_02960 [Bryobacterales bacterium]|nr:hypothetical protein [Bryobacterales bacterium]